MPIKEWLALRLILVELPEQLLHTRTLGVFLISITIQILKSYVRSGSGNTNLNLIIGGT